MTSGVDHNDWLIGYMDHNDYDSVAKTCSMAILRIYRHTTHTGYLVSPMKRNPYQSQPDMILRKK